MKQKINLALCLTLILALLLLTACAPNPPATPAPSVSVEPTAPPTPEPTAEVIRFTFTEENFPRLDGSTATIPLGEAIQSVLLGKPRSDCGVNFSKTSGAYFALAANETDLLLVYDGGEEVRQEVNADALFDTAPIGFDALVFLVNADNPVDNLTTEQVRQIFTGELTNWNQVGGSNETIRAYQRGNGSGSQALMDKLVMDGAEMGRPETIPIVGEMGGLVDAVADYTGGSTGIGYNVYFFVTEMYENPAIKLLSIDGVAPTYDSIADGSYPFISEFYAVIRNTEKDDSPARILYHWLQTESAQAVIRSEKYVSYLN
jgi:ABC-type phosphate transport system, periplasmic component